MSSDPSRPASETNVQFDNPLAPFGGAQSTSGDEAPLQTPTSPGQTLHSADELSINGEPDDEQMLLDPSEPLDDHGESEINVPPVERLVSFVVGVGLVGRGLARGKIGGLAMTLLGGALVWRGTTGQCWVYKQLGIEPGPADEPTDPLEPSAGRSVNWQGSIIVDRPAGELFAFWRELSHLPALMPHLAEVEDLGDNRSLWRARGPWGSEIEWEAEITLESPERELAWKSLPGSALASSGRVRFEPAPNNQGTIVSVEMRYDPPGGVAGVVVSKLLGSDVASELKGALRRLKQHFEAGEIATVDGQPQGSCEGGIS